MIISSNRDLAVELAELVGKSDMTAVETNNTRINVDGKMLHKILVANRESLIAQNMLEDGNSRKEAEKQMDIVFKIADLFKDAAVELDVSREEMNLKMNVRFDDAIIAKSK